MMRPAPASVSSKKRLAGSNRPLAVTSTRSSPSGLPSERRCARISSVRTCIGGSSARSDRAPIRIASASARSRSISRRSLSEAQRGYSRAADVILPSTVAAMLM